MINVERSKIWSCVSLPDLLSRERSFSTRICICGATSRAFRSTSAGSASRIR